jgi:hypothetical protein
MRPSAVVRTRPPARAAFVFEIRRQRAKADFEAMLTAEIYVAAQRHEHVVRRGDLLAIEKDVGDRRQPVKLDVVRSVRFEIATVPDLALIERNRIVP